ncbi:hypothetical protein VIBNISFn118_1690007 [Vibrio nigripulchritudo SFn118]|nr:hypothetical protein VIBNISFn118_1690007 [Vibrio nigripulchritudo SFn118]
MKRPNLTFELHLSAEAVVKIDEKWVFLNGLVERLFTKIFQIKHIYNNINFSYLFIILHIKC